MYIKIEQDICDIHFKEKLNEELLWLKFKLSNFFL